MVNMTNKILVIDQDIIHNAAEVIEVLEGLVHSAVIVFSDGGEAKRCMQELVMPEGADKCGEQLAFFAQWH